jgi:hypothetical protein
VCAIPVPVFALIFAGIALSDIKRSGGSITGRALAVTGATIGFGWFALAFAAAIAVPLMLAPNDRLLGVQAHSAAVAITDSVSRCAAAGAQGSATCAVSQSIEPTLDAGARELLGSGCATAPGACVTWDGHTYTVRVYSGPRAAPGVIFVATVTASGVVAKRSCTTTREADLAVCNQARWD